MLWFDRFAFGRCVVATGSDTDRNNLAEAVAQLGGRATGGACPVCEDAILSRSSLDEVALTTCSSCRGVLISEAALEHLIRLHKKRHWRTRRRVIGEMLMEMLDLGPPSAPSLPEPAAPIACASHIDFAGLIERALEEEPASGGQLCLKVEDADDPEVWIDVTRDCLNMAYPLSGHPAAALPGRGLELPAHLGIVDWDDGAFLTLEYPATQVEAAAQFLASYFEIVLEHPPDRGTYQISELLL